MKHYQLQTYRKILITVDHGEGVYVYDTEGKPYLDFYGGHAVALTGHCHPTVLKAICEQAGKLLFYSNAVYNSLRAEYSKMLIEAAPQGMGQVFFCNSGAEANETVMKIARRFTGKPDIIVMKEGFHGRTMGALSATAVGNYREHFRPLLPGYGFAEFGSLESVAELMSSDTAAVMLEPVQSMSGARVAEPEYYQGLRALCDEHTALLIFDEVQTGFGRTGTMFAGEHWNIVPDLISLAKGIASGVPMGAALVHERIAATIGYGEHGSTFGGSPLACAAAKATLQVIQDEALVENAAKQGAYLSSQLSKLAGVEKVQGLGLLLGVQTSAPAKAMQGALFDAGCLVGGSSREHIIRLLPPLTISQADSDAFLALFKEALVEA